ncbi:hypothetical protein E1301_Tti017262 [Triplophysa tibetana]|uniref:Uncharacterized protein n=1 Tax=Triplophysa tibetana TaxID=1572043 RepID=A0A5A9N6E2_9TELE|nr:hypothetical protein E1301_Tti017262 [Triplophysa tibetana]
MCGVRHVSKETCNWTGGEKQTETQRPIATDAGAVEQLLSVKRTTDDTQKQVPDGMLRVQAEVEQVQVRLTLIKWPWMKWIRTFKG